MNVCLMRAIAEVELVRFRELAREKQNTLLAWQLPNEPRERQPCRRVADAWLLIC
jgi:hypothetical protein